MPNHTLAIKTINQYRRRDTVAHLGLRYYLQTNISRKNQWAKNVAADYVLDNTSPLYHTSEHFKDFNSVTNDVEYRRICIPEPAEMIAESWLISKFHDKSKGTIFQHPSNVYSYLISDSMDNSGVFAPYYKGFRRRQIDISLAAAELKNSRVTCIDLRKFYPSIPFSLAMQVWRETAESIGMTKMEMMLGEKLLENHKGFCSPIEKSILTGPMFSHLIANLVLFNIDHKMNGITKKRYFRYVDDIAFVGNTKDILTAEEEFTKFINDIGLEIHPDKRIETHGHEWISSLSDLNSESGTYSWKVFLGRLKQALLCRPDLTPDISTLLKTNGMRIRPLSYVEAVKEASYLEKMYFWVHRPFVRKRIRNESATGLIRLAIYLRDQYTTCFWDLVDTKTHDSPFQRKRNTSALKKYASRLILIGDIENFPAFSEALQSFSELRLHSVIFNTIYTGNIDNLISLGADAAHAAANPIYSHTTKVACTKEILSEAEIQAISILISFGLHVEFKNPPGQNPMYDFCAWTHNGHMHNSKEAFSYFGILSSLHGQSEHAHHEKMLCTAFDTSERLMDDVSSILRRSSSW